MKTFKRDVIVAFGSVPKDGGTFTLYRTIRPKLLEHGIDLRCVSVGKGEADVWDEDFVDEGCVLLAAETTNVKKQAKAFASWCEDVSIDIVMAINSVAMLSALPHLPEKIRVMSRCANAFDHGYRITVSCYERLMRIVATTPRLIRDLTRHYSVDEDRLCLIPNGIKPSLFDRAARKKRSESGALRLGYLGRLEHNQKGVLFLPEIIRSLHDRGIEFILKIAGKGVHGKFLGRELKYFIHNSLVEFVGSIPPSAVPGFLEDVDIFIFPSQFEGCPNALLEALMAGCVPVAWKIEGINDFIIKDGQTGLLCPMGDCDALVGKIGELAMDRERLQQMSLSAATDARERFSQERAAANYAALIKQVMEEPALAWAPRPWSDFKPDPAFETSCWRSIIPVPLKRIFKNSLFYLRLSKRYEE